MIHLYISLPSVEVEGGGVVDDISVLNAGIGLAQAAAGDDEISRQIARAHIVACEGLVALIAGAPSESQIREIRSAVEVGIPVLVLSDDATVDIVEGGPVQTFTPETFHEFVDTLTPRQ
ncbi:MAG TPA: hypothetical protein VMM14_05650 [Acidimicrobiia bacterium]|nr:hypothetical protein [Acidimicrobiia bacterium]